MTHRPRTRRALLPLAALAALALPGPAELGAQQSRDHAPGDGEWSVMFTLFEPDVVTHLGVFRMVGDRINLGLEADLNWADGEQRVEPDDGIPTRAEGTTWTASVGPTVRWYGSRIGPVSPYLRSRLAIGWGGSELYVNDVRQNEEESVSVNLSLGIGAEWYPVSGIGIGGHTGIQWTRTDTDRRSDSQGTDYDGTTQNLRTFRSGLVISFYFR